MDVKIHGGKFKFHPTMYGEGFVLLLLLTLFTYLLIERKHVTKLWNKCRSLIFNYNKLKYNKRKYLSLLEFSRWQYRGEGNEYLAISLPQQRKILRLRKTTCPKGLISFMKNWCHQCFDMNVVADERRAATFEKLNLEYYKVLVRLIGECFVQPSEEILLKRSDINKVNKIIASSRPEYRKKKHIGYTCGSLLTDYAYLPIDWDVLQFSGPTFAVEIKPKQGWIPPNERSYQLCTYCLNQYIKLQNGEISSVSDYCPMDLFSGRKSRMNSAIQNLLKTPQNNIKIFLEGGLIYGENNNQKLPEAISNIFENSSKNEENNTKYTNELCDLITNALLKQIYSNNHKCPTTSSSSSNLNVNVTIKKNSKLKKCDFSCRNQLPRGCVLERILQLQQLDIWGAEQLAEMLMTTTTTTTTDNYQHASNVAARAKKSITNNCARCFFIEATATDLESSIQKYIMSAIAKDCSLMLTFRRLTHLGNHLGTNERNFNLIQTHLGLYAFNIGVFDLYPKPLSCILKHVRKRTKFCQIYGNITSQFY